MEAPFRARAACPEIVSELFARPAALWGRALLFSLHAVSPIEKAFALIDQSDNPRHRSFSNRPSFLSPINNSRGVRPVHYPL